MNNTKDLFQIIRLGITLDDIDDASLHKHINNTNEYGRNLLHEAIANHQETYALFLIEKGINVNHKDENGATPLHYTAVYKMLNVAASILKHNGNPDLVDKYGNGPLWTAVFNARGNYDLVKLLKAYNANTSHTNSNNKSPLDFAKQIKDDILVRILTS